MGMSLHWRLSSCPLPSKTGNKVSNNLKPQSGFSYVMARLANNYGYSK